MPPPSPREMCARTKASDVPNRPDIVGIPHGFLSCASHLGGCGCLEHSEALLKRAKTIPVELWSGLRFERRVVDPPVHPHLFGLVDGTDHQADLEGQQLDLDQIDAD